MSRDMSAGQPQSDAPFTPGDQGLNPADGSGAGEGLPGEGRSEENSIKHLGNGVAYPGQAFGLAAQAGGIDPELLPYLEAADAPDDLEIVAVNEGGQSAAEDEDDELTAALREIISHTVVDAQMLDELLEEDLAAEAEEGYAEEDDSASPGKGGGAQAAAGAQRPVASLHLGAPTPASATASPAEREALAQADEIYRHLLTRQAEHDINPSLDRVAGVLDIVGDPQQQYRTVHVTGTNGKTSVSRMVESLARHLGYRTGLFTSPHLSEVRERICVDGQAISPAEFVAAWQDIAPYVEMVDSTSSQKGRPRLSFFEALVVCSLAYFADVPIDLGVIEVGMGGRWDATNVIDSQVSVIMPISPEHEKWLGQGIEAIAREKAGIIKPGSIAVVSQQEEAALEIISTAAQEVDATLRLEGRDFEILRRQNAVGGQVLTIRTPAATYEDIFLPLFGAHQAQNAACALVAMEALSGGRVLDGAAVAQAFEQVTSPGRFEVLRSSPMVVTDAGHNPGAAQAIAQTLVEDFGWNYAVGIYSAMGDKDVETILSELEPHLEHLVVTPMEGERAMALEDLEKIASEVFGPDRVTAAAKLLDALDLAGGMVDAQELPAGRAGVLIFGSVVLAGMARELLRGEK